MVDVLRLGMGGWLGFRYLGERERGEGGFELGVFRKGSYSRIGVFFILTPNEPTSASKLFLHFEHPHHHLVSR